VRPARRYRSGMDDATDPITSRVAQNCWFWLLLFRPGPHRDQDEETAEAIQRAHLAHLFELEATGRLCLFGPVLDADDLRGIGVLTVSTRAEAEALVARDPAVQSGRLILEVRPWFTLPGGSLPLDGSPSPDAA
jgi:uncharacterized protein YciI